MRLIIRATFRAGTPRSFCAAPAGIRSTLDMPLVTVGAALSGRRHVEHAPRPESDDRRLRAAGAEASDGEHADDGSSTGTSRVASDAVSAER